MIHITDSTLEEHAAFDVMTGLLDTAGQDGGLPIPRMRGYLLAFLATSCRVMGRHGTAEILRCAIADNDIAVALPIKARPVPGEGPCIFFPLTLWCGGMAVGWIVGRFL